ncbi:uncharacterized protein LOC117057518, partial [Lacerta agilis]|uniref:uncharacterized protein LOC117057518 n=1 Tax=Lacerta agilis TaxID=80427 RepID=UPI001419DCD9
MDLLLGYQGEAYAVEVMALVLQAMDYKPPVDDPSSVTCLMQITHVCLLATLNTLKESDLKKFKDILSMFPFKEGYVSIPRKLLKKANVWELTELLLAHCDEDYAVEVASEVLKAFDCEPQPECLPGFTWKGLDQTPLKAAGPVEPQREGSRKMENPAGPGEGVMCEFCSFSAFHNISRLLYCFCSQIPLSHDNVQPASTFIFPFVPFRVRSTEAGSFYCGDTDLICEVKEAVTVTYHFDSWPKHLEEQTTEELHVAGPLLSIKVDADAVQAVAAIHIPHCLCLEGEDSSHVYIAHFVEGEMRLEKPDRVEPHHAVLENPKFSSLGVVFKKWFKQKINTVVLLYHTLQLETPTFHLYLLPNDSSIVKAVEKHEVNSKRIEKPPMTLK